MSGSAIKAWLISKQRRALFSAILYFAATCAAGGLALIPQIVIPFAIGKLLTLAIFPMVDVNIFGWSLTALWIVALFWDCVRANRDDMAIIPLWLAREFFHLGPRLMLEGWESLARARKFTHIETGACAEVLGYMISKPSPTTREELTRFFPWFVWEHLVPQLLTIDGVVLYRGSQRLSLFTPLRLELRQWVAHLPAPEMPQPEPETAPVEEPERLSPHEILGVSANASAAEIKIAYRNRVKECHPDRFTNTDEHSRELAEEWTKAINAAYSELLAQRGR